MKQKHQKRDGIRFTKYLEEDEYLIWVGEPQENRFIKLRHKHYSILNALGSSVLLLLATVSLYAVFFSAILIILPLFLFSLALLSIFKVGKSYYAISNKRFLVIKQAIVTSVYSEALEDWQSPRIKEDEYNSFSLHFVPRKPAEKSRLIEDLRHEDAKIACELLNAEREEQAEILEIPQ